MENDIKKAFQKASYLPDSRLSGDIWCLIEKKESNKIKMKLWGYSFLGFISMFGFIPVFKNLLEQLSSSGFYQYLSLIVSEGGTIILYWREFLLSLTDSLPFASILASLFLLFVLFVSIKKLLEQYKSVLLIA